MDKHTEPAEETADDDYSSIPSEEIEPDKNDDTQLLTTLDKKEQMTEREMEQFCQQLHEFIQQIQSLDQIKKIYKYSREMSDRLEAEVNELKFLLLEVNSVIKDIQRMKMQRQNIKTESKSVRKMFVRTKQQELNEMELVIAVYDKDILRKWHTAKRTNTVISLEAFIAEMNGKREATDYALKMAKEKLQSIASSPRSRGNSVKSKISNFNAIPLNSPANTYNTFTFT